MEHANKDYKKNTSKLQIANTTKKATIFNIVDITHYNTPDRKKNVAHETAICRNPPIHNFTGDRTPLPIFHRPTLKRVVFLRRHEKQFFFFFFKF
jgi:hypothetical protein